MGVELINELLRKSGGGLVDTGGNMRKKLKNIRLRYIRKNLNEFDGLPRLDKRGGPRGCTGVLDPQYATVSSLSDLKCLV